MKYKFRRIGIEVTSICNNSCIVCPRATMYEKTPSTMPIELFHKIIIDISENMIEKTVVLGGMGDPSCDNLLIDRLRFAKERTPELDIIISSNMEVWSKKYSDIIVEENLLSKLRFSVFAVTEDASFKIYRNKTYAANARRNIEYFLKKNEENGRPVRTSIYTLMLEENKIEIDIIKEIYWDKVEEFEVWKPHSWSNRYPHLRERLRERQKCNRVEEFEASIRVNGDMCACSMDINHNLVYGNLHNQTIEEIYESDSYKYFRDLNRDGLIENLEMCRDCSFLNKNENALIEKKLSECEKVYK